MKKLERYMSQVQPYNCKKEQFKGVKAIMHEMMIGLHEGKDEIKELRNKLEREISQVQEINDENLALKKQLGCFDGSTRTEKA